MELVATEQLTTKFEISSLNMEKLLSWVEQGKKGSSRRTVEGLETKMRRRKKKKFVFIFAIMAPSLLREASTKQIRKLLQASTVLHSYAPSDARVETFSVLVREKKFSLSFFEG